MNCVRQLRYFKGENPPPPNYGLVHPSFSADFLRNAMRAMKHEKSATFRCLLHIRPKEA